MKSLIKVIIIISVLLSIFYKCDRIKTVKEYYDDGSIKSLYYVDDEKLIDGEYKLFYKNGIIREIRQYKKGHIIDTIKYFSKSGNLKGGSYPKKDSIYTYNVENDKLIKEGVSKKDNRTFSNKYYSGWIKYYREGLLKKRILYKYIHNKGAHINQYYEYDSLSKIDKSKSCYFNLIIKDTMILRKSYLGSFSFNSDMDKTIGFFTIVSDKISEDFENINQIKLDTFYNSNNPDFTYTPKSLGLKTLKGKFTEQFMDIQVNQKDTSKVDVSIKYRDFYFEKDVFIKDSIQLEKEIDTPKYKA